jgi:hypothetical protein
MVPSKELFELIKSMTKTEKRYFKKYTSLNAVGGKNQYALIFNAVDRQKEYDEKKLLEKLKGYHFTAHFAVVKNHLYSRILDSLEHYHSNMSIHSQMRKTIGRIELLQKRGLYNHSLKLIKKVKKEAKESELNTVLLEIFTLWEFGFHLEKYDLDAMEQIYSTINTVSGAITETSVCRYLCLKMVNLYVSYMNSRDKKYLAQAEKLVKSKIFRIAENTTVLAGKRSICEFYFFYWYAKGNLKKAYTSGVTLIGLLRENMPLLKKNTGPYISVLNNLYILAMDQQKYNEARAHLDNINSTSEYLKTFSQRAKHFFLYHSDLLHFLYKTGQLKLLEKQLVAITKEYIEYETEFNNYENIEFLAVIAISNYYVGNLKRAIEVLNKMRNEYALSENPEIQSFCNLFYIIVQYDAGNSDLLPYLIQSYYRFLRKKGQISKLENSIIRFLRKLSLIYSEKQLQIELRKFKIEAEALSSDQFDNYVFKYFDFIPWLTSKIEKKSFAEVISEKVKASPKTE